MHLTEWELWNDERPVLIVLSSSYGSAPSTRARSASASARSAASSSRFLAACSASPDAIQRRIASSRAAQTLSCTSSCGVVAILPSRHIVASRGALPYASVDVLGPSIGRVL